MRSPNKYLLALLLAWSTVPAAQSSDTCHVQSLLVSAMDVNGNTFRTLATPSFQLKVDKRPVEVVRSEYRLEPHRIAVLLDSSGSMGAGENKWEVARTAAQEMLSMTPPQVSIALSSYGDKVDKVLEFSGDRLRALQWLAAASSRDKKIIKGRTALLDAIMIALRELQPYRTGDAIYVITDGGDNVSQVVASKVKQALLGACVRLFMFRLDSGWLTDKEQIGLDEAGVRLFALLLAERPGTSVTTEEGHTITPLADTTDDTMALAKNTGGSVFLIPPRPYTTNEPLFDNFDFNERTRESIRAYTRASNLLMNGSYFVQFAAPETSKWQDVSLQVVGEGNQRLRDITLTFPNRLPPCQMRLTGVQ
jgi:VWA domain-containing protein